VVLGALGGLGIDLGLPAILGSIVALLAFLGGLLYLAGMKDRTGWFIAALALSTFWAAAGTMFAAEVPQVGGLISGILGGAFNAVGPAAAGVLIMVVYDWVMGAMSSK